MPNRSTRRSAGKRNDPREKALRVALQTSTRQDPEYAVQVFREALAGPLEEAKANILRDEQGGSHVVVMAPDLGMNVGADKLAVRLDVMPLDEYLGRDTSGAGDLVRETMRERTEGEVVVITMSYGVRRVDREPLAS